MRGYQTILANSSFTASWIDRLWERSAEVVYPPVSLKMHRTKKQNSIISIGRFVGKDRKNHTDQLKAFPSFLSRVEGDWSLTLVGFSSDLPEDKTYLSQLRAQAGGLPVKFVVNAERREVLEILAKAKLYWHTAGIGIDQNETPYRLEHFGISTVEAMRAECVPIVSANGGQAEIVEHGLNGFLCHSLEEMVQYSSTVAKDENIRVQMSGRAEERSQKFRAAVFEQHVSRLISSTTRLDLDEKFDLRKYHH